MVDFVSHLAACSYNTEVQILNIKASTKAILPSGQEIDRSEQDNHFI